MKTKLAAFLAGIVGFGVGAVSIAHSSPDTKSLTRTIHLIANTTEQRFLDLGPTGFSLGDQAIFHGTLWAKVKRVGEEGGACSAVSVTRSEFQCTLTFSLPGGRIATQGVMLPRAGTNARFVFPITGGSGAYRNAGGQVRVVQLSEGKSDITLYVTR
jgi:hypothetical protein